jgi:hypothetical protein
MEISMDVFSESGGTHDYLYTNTALAAELPNVMPNNVENRSW